MTHISHTVPLHSTQLQSVVSERKRDGGSEISAHPGLSVALRNIGPGTWAAERARRKLDIKGPADHSMPKDMRSAWEKFAADRGCAAKASFLSDVAKLKSTWSKESGVVLKTKLQPIADKYFNTASDSDLGIFGNVRDNITAALGSDTLRTINVFNAAEKEVSADPEINRLWTQFLASHYPKPIELSALA